MYTNLENNILLPVTHMYISEQEAKKKSIFQKCYNHTILVIFLYQFNGSIF